jgi:hypothetical protein
MAYSDPENLTVPLVWVGAEELPAQFVNQMVVQHPGANEFVLTFGLLSPPLLLGTPEQQLEQARSIPYVPVTPVARVGLTRERLLELINALQRNLENHDVKYKKE